MSDSSSTPMPESKKLPPMLILVGGLIGFIVLIVVFIWVASMFDRKPTPEDVLEPMLASQTLPDGSQLILKAATLGTTHVHSQPYPRPENSMFTARPTEARMNFVTEEQRLGLWFEQFHIPEYEPDDLNWWTKTSVLDERGQEIFDLDSARFVHYQFGSGTELGGRPYSPVDRSNLTQIVAGVALFPMFRNANDTLTVRIYGIDPKPVAEFVIPNPMLAKPFPVWTPEPFPISNTISGITMTLEDVQYFRRKYTSSSGAVSYSFRLNPIFNVSQDGETITEGVVDDIVVSDALGHTGGIINPGLPLDESAWKLTVPWRPDPSTVTDAGRVIVSGDVETRSADQAPNRLSEALRRGTSRITLLAIGAGKQELRNLIPLTGRRGSAMTNEKFAGEYQGLDLYSDERGNRLQIESHVSWLVLQAETSPAETVDLLLLDEHDGVVESKAVDVRELTVLFFEAPEGLLRLKAVVQETLPFEFTFAPPEVVDE